MQIRLQQAEIISALKQYVSSQGISLAGKTIEIAFTAGRGATGLSADIVIEEAVASNDSTVNEDRPALSVISGPVANDEVKSEPTAEAQATGTSDAAPAKATTSLFGN